MRVKGRKVVLTAHVDYLTELDEVIRHERCSTCTWFSYSTTGGFEYILKYCHVLLLKAKGTRTQIKSICYDKIFALQKLLNCVIVVGLIINQIGWQILQIGHSTLVFWSRGAVGLLAKACIQQRYF